MRKTHVASIVSWANTDPLYRIWCQTISDAFDAIDVDLVPGMGNTDLTTVNRPGVANTYTAYQIRKLPDPVGSGASPVYIKLWYGVGSTGTQYPKLVFQLCDSLGAPGAPNLGTFATNAVIAQSGATDSSLPTPLYAVSDDDGFWMTFGSFGQRAFFAVDRQRNPNGVAEKNPGWPNCTYLGLCHTATASSNQFNYVIPDTVGLTASTLSFVTNRTPIVPGGVIGTTTSMKNSQEVTTVFPFWIPGRQGVYASKMVVGIAGFDAPIPGMHFRLEHLGEERTYRTMGLQFPKANGRADAGACVAVWWDDHG